MIQSQVSRTINSMTLFKIGRCTNVYIFILFKYFITRAKSQVQMIKKTEWTKKAKLFTYTFFVVFTLELYKYFI